MSEERYPGEDTTRPRWRCIPLRLVEHCKSSDKGPEAAKKRLLKRARQLGPRLEDGYHPLLEYRAGVI